MLQDDFLELKARESAEPPVGLEANYKTVKNQGRYTLFLFPWSSHLCVPGHISVTLFLPWILALPF